MSIQDEQEATDESVVGDIGKRRKRNRKRSKRRDIFCLEHNDCYLESMSPKRPIYADQPEQLRSLGISRKKATMLIAQKTTVALSDEWLEAFWCQECYETKWYRVRRGHKEDYSIQTANRELWQRAQGVISPDGNPLVGEFTRRQACTSMYHLLRS